jgi:hypothetical protein
MTLLEVRDFFTTFYKLECVKHQVKEIDFQDKIIAAWISAGQQEIVDRLKLLETYYDLAYTAQTTFTPLSLASVTDFGKLLRTEPELNIVGINDLNTYNADGDVEQGEVDSIAVWHDGVAFKVGLSNLPSSAGTIRLWYQKNTGYYSPSGSSSQNWGTFDGSTFTGNLKIPEKYLDLLIKYMLGQIFPDKQQEYETVLQRFKGDSISTSKGEIGYNLGWY